MNIDKTDAEDEGKSEKCAMPGCGLRFTTRDELIWHHYASHKYSDTVAVIPEAGPSKSTGQSKTSPQKNKAGLCASGNKSAKDVAKKDKETKVFGSKVTKDRNAFKAKANIQRAVKKSCTALLKSPSNSLYMNPVHIAPKGTLLPKHPEGWQTAPSAAEFMTSLQVLFKNAEKGIYFISVDSKMNIIVRGFYKFANFGVPVTTTAIIHQVPDQEIVSVMRSLTIRELSNDVQQKTADFSKNTNVCPGTSTSSCPQMNLNVNAISTSFSKTIISKSDNATNSSSDSILRNILKQKAPIAKSSTAFYDKEYSDAMDCDDANNRSVSSTEMEVHPTVKTMQNKPKGSNTKLLPILPKPSGLNREAPPIVIPQHIIAMQNVQNMQVEAMHAFGGSGVSGENTQLTSYLVNCEGNGNITYFKVQN